MRKSFRGLAYVLVVCILAGCIPMNAIADVSQTEVEDLKVAISEELDELFDNDQIQVSVESIQIKPYSERYMEEYDFNTRKANWFGFYLDEINKQFDGQSWIFITGENGETVVELFRPYDNTYEKALRNVAIGAGVILFCVTVSVVSGGLGVPALSAVFAVSAKTAATYGLSSGAISGVLSGIVATVQTGGDIEAVLKAAAKSGSEGFLTGTVSGAFIGGATEFTALKSATVNGLSMNEVASIQKETGWSINTIKKLKSTKEFNIYKNAGLREVNINGKTRLIRDIDLNYKSTVGGERLTNLQRMSKGYAPIDPKTGLSYQLHHVNQETDGILAILTQSEHLSNPSILNTVGKDGVHSLLGSSWNSTRIDEWKDIGTYFLNSIEGGVM